MKKQMLSILEGNKTNLSSRQFVGRDLPHPLLLGQEEKQPCFTRDVEDPRQRPSGMTPVFYNDNSMGFTLIELLVVVLIIGILASVALPQYKVAVEKARMAEAMTILKSVKEAQERYYLANGDYATKFEDLDIDIAGTMNVAGTIITLPSGVRIGVAFNNTGATNKNNTISLISFYTHTLSDLRQCYAKQNDVVANQVCKNLGGKIPYDSSGGCALGACTIYTL